MNSEQQMGEITQLAYSFIEEDLLVMDNELDPMDVLDFLQDGDNFKRVADLLKETMIMAGIPADVKNSLKEYSSVSDFLNDLKAGKLKVSALTNDDSTDAFINALLALLSQQESECQYQKRKYNWNRPTISRWFSENQSNCDSKSGTSESIRSRDDAIAICFALGLDYPNSRDFLNKSGHAIFNIRDHEDAVYIYCLTKQRPLSVAKELIYNYSVATDLVNKYSDRLAHSNITEDEERHEYSAAKEVLCEYEKELIQKYDEKLADPSVSVEESHKYSVAKDLIHGHKEDLVNLSIGAEENITHTGNTTMLLANQILGNSNWETDEDFFGSFLLPNMANFISYSRTALKEYYKIKNPIYLLALKTIVAYEKDNGGNGSGFDARKIQEYIHKVQKDREITIPMSSVQVTYNFINKLRKYSDSSDLLKNANDMLDIHIERVCEKGWKEEDFRAVNNSLDVIDYIINNNATYSNDEKEMETVSDFLTETVTAYKMLCTWLPSVVIDDEDGNEYIQEYIDTEGNIKKRIQKKDKRQRSYNQSTLSDTVLSSFPHRNFFTQFEKRPKELVHDVSLRKAIILLFYMNYARNLIQEISNPNTTEEEMAFGFDDFYEAMNIILGNCQLGKLYYANPFDWLILESIEKLATYYDDDDIESPVSFLDKVLSFSFGSEDDSDD